tara:strand:- start:249 stop:1106 length:858 start_codon:yes stop_codon:yes gene_type:complete
MSIRNNEDRTGSPQDNSPAPQVAESSTQPTHMGFTVPTQFVEIPSAGKYYPQGHPLHNKDTVEIRYMTARDEDVLTNKSYLKNGVVIDKLIENILVDKSIPVASLMVGDKSALIVAARITGYGSEYTTKIVCPSCTETTNFSFDLESSISVTNASQSGLDYEETNSGTFIITVPKSQATIELRPLTGEDEKSINSTNKMRVKNGLGELTLTDQMKQYIVSINGNYDRSFVNSSVEMLPALDARFIRLNYPKLIPNIDLTQNFECNACGYEQDMEVPFTSDFFWPE